MKDATPESPDFAPAADDRQGREMPGSPDLNALLALWRDRDVLYAQSPKRLTEAQIEVIRRGRVREANFLPVADRAKAAGRAMVWYPPQHGQGTGDDK
jgi:hypothetical protein